MDGIILTRHLFIVPLMALSFGGVADTVRVLNGHALAASPESRSGLPTLNVDSACRDVASNELNKTSDYPGCVSKEQKARADLGKEWASYPSDMQSQCVHLVTPPALPSYVTLQQCLQMSRDARNLSKEGRSKPDRKYNASLPRSADALRRMRRGSVSASRERGSTGYFLRQVKSAVAE